MRKNVFGITTIEILVIVGILGLMLSISAKSYRSYVESIDVNNTNNDFDNVVEYLGRELSEIKESLDQYPEDKRDSLSQGLDSIREWANLINSEIDLKTDNVIIESIDGTIADKNLVVKIQESPEKSIEFVRVRNNEIKTIHITPDLNDGMGKIGAQLQPNLNGNMRKAKGIEEILGKSNSQFIDILVKTINGYKGLITDFNSKHE